MPISRRTMTAGLLVLVLAGGSGMHAGDEPASASYRLAQATLNSSGETSESANFRLDGSLGQETTVGASSSPRFVAQSGFWSFLGSGVVPVVLTARRNAVLQANVDLQWSGNNAPYDLFQSSNCTDVFVVPFASTSKNALANIDSPAATLTCFNVLPTAPGPK